MYLKECGDVPREKEEWVKLKKMSEVANMSLVPTITKFSFLVSKKFFFNFWPLPMSLFSLLVFDVKLLFTSLTKCHAGTCHVSFLMTTMPNHISSMLGWYPVD